MANESDAPSHDAVSDSETPLNWWYECDRCRRQVPRGEDRHKCQECPDFDYCPRCAVDAELIHPGHRFEALDAPDPDGPRGDSPAEGKPQRCRTCAPVARLLPLLKFALDRTLNPEAPGRNKLAIRWSPRLSGLIEGAQRGCAFCCYFMHTFFRPFNGEAHLYEESRPWYARPAEHDEERTNLVEHCMSTLTRLKHDRFDFYVLPLRTRDGGDPADVDKLRFGLADSTLDRFTEEELREARVFHSAGDITAERYIFAADNNPAARYLSHRPPNPNPGSDTVIAQLRTWLQTCDTHHHTACRPSTPGTLPTRLLDISSPSTVHLHHPSPTSPPPRYAALSYCWGGPQAVQATAATVASLATTGIPLSTLPLTLQHAATTARRIGLRYLWVDALCIVQDSAADKFRELARMADIYKHAYVTVVAARAGAAGAGFLADRADTETGLWRALVPMGYAVPRDEEETKAAVAAAGGRIGAAVGEVVDTEDGTVYLLDEAESMAASVKDPVARRAWCLQERVLSPRVVSFGRRVTWRCGRAVGGDAGVVGAGGEEDPVGKRLTKAVVSDGGEAGEGGLRLDHFRTAQLMETWRVVLEDYTRRELGLVTDRLPAIAGVAREIARVTGMEYLAGLWRENMLQDLMWYSRTQEWRSRPAPAGDEFPPAPTWSWAAVEAPVLCDAVTPDATPMATVLRCEVRAVEGKSHFDVVAGGTVEVRGPLGELDKDDVIEMLKKQDYAPAPPASGGVQEWYRLLMEDQATRPRTDVSMDDVADALPDRVFGLMLFQRDWTQPRWDKELPRVSEDCYSGLLLREVGGKYERIGAFYNDASEVLDRGAKSWKEETVTLV